RSRITDGTVCDRARFCLWDSSSRPVAGTSRLSHREAVPEPIESHGSARPSCDSSAALPHRASNSPTTGRVRRTKSTPQFDGLLGAIPGRLTEDGVDAARTDRVMIETDLPRQPDEVAVSQLGTAPGAEVLSPKHLRRDLHDHAQAAAELNV